MIKMVLAPAYGRTYATKEQCSDAWIEGKDFLILKGPWKGSYCSIRDYNMMPYESYIMWNHVDATRVK